MNFIKQKPFSAKKKAKIHNQIKCVWGNQDRSSISTHSFLLQNTVLLVKQSCCYQVIPYSDEAKPSSEGTEFTDQVSALTQLQHDYVMNLPYF